MQQRGTNSVALQNPSGSVQIPLLQPAWGGLCWGQLEGVQLSREGDELWSGFLPWSQRSGNSSCFVTFVSVLSCTILCLLAWQTISRRNSIPAMAVQKIVHGDLLPDSLPLALFFFLPSAFYSHFRRHWWSSSNCEFSFHGTILPFPHLITLGIQS